MYLCWGGGGGGVGVRREEERESIVLGRLEIY